MSTDRDAAARAIDAFLLAIGRDPSREPDLVGTGARVAAAFIDELCDGYAKNAEAIVRANVLPGTTDLVVLRDVPVATTCPHHLMPAIGTGTIAFAPRQKLVGLGTMAELLDAFAHRLTLQEQIGESVVLLLMAELEPRWVACRLALQHGCLSARGERKHGAVAETLAFAGDSGAREEALKVLGAPKSA
jgi:GTP cyclohydrolase IA